MDKEEEKKEEEVEEEKRAGPLKNCINPEKNWYETVPTNRNFSKYKFGRK